MTVESGGGNYGLFTGIPVKYMRELRRLSAQTAAVDKVPVPFYIFPAKALGQ